ncbi:MAG TPA: ABATE domain-containing protein [Chloroflexota bacterium]|nr:ABATE domain-containing protein [Chloroflexota bacterium]
MVTSWRGAAPRFPLLGEPPAVDLVNTVWRSGQGQVDGLATERGLAAWLRAQGERLDPGEGSDAGARLPALREVHALRAALRALFEATLGAEPPPPDAVAALNRFSAGGASHPQLEWTPGHAPRVRRRVRAADPAAALLAAIAWNGIALLGGEERLRLRRCEGPGCVLFFVATNPRRRWCSPALCGNRVRVARHYRLHHADHHGTDPSLRSG